MMSLSFLTTQMLWMRIIRALRGAANPPRGQTSADVGFDPRESEDVALTRGTGSPANTRWRPAA